MARKVHQTPKKRKKVKINKKLFFLLLLVLLNKNAFDFLYVIGRGGFGKVSKRKSIFNSIQFFILLH
jgi:hypothetical protein